MTNDVRVGIDGGGGSGGGGGGNGDGSISAAGIESVEQQQIPRHLQLRSENIQNGERVCGYFKCLVTLQTDPTKGFLIARYGRGEFYERMVYAYNFSVNVLDREFGMKHIYTAPPFNTEVDDDDLWNAITNNHTQSYDGQGSIARFTIHNLGTRRVIVQPVEIIPKNETIFFGCTRERLSAAFQQLFSVFPQRPPSNLPNNIMINNNNNSSSSSSRNNHNGNSATVTTASSSRLWTEKIHQIAQTVSSEFNSLYRVLDDHPELYDDFQMFLTSHGHLIHMDVDRIYKDGKVRKDKGNGRRRKCGPIIRIWEEKILKYLEWVSGSNFTNGTMPSYR